MNILHPIKALLHLLQFSQNINNNNRKKTQQKNNNFNIETNL